MDLDLGPEIAEFRARLRDWIAANAPAELAGLTDWTTAATAGGYQGAELASASADPAYAEWERRLADARLICPQWPAELPRVRRGMGESLVGPSVIVHGTPEQRAHFLPRIISGEDVYCQGFSEPDHGSDLAAVETRGVAEGDE